MNRFEAIGLDAEAIAGKKIIVVTRAVEENSVVLNHLLAAAEATEHRRRVSRANGLQSIDYDSGGTVRVRSYRQGTRGMMADIVFLDDDVDRMLSVPHGWGDVHASLAASPHHEIIRS